MDINEAIEKIKVKDESGFEYIYLKTKSLVYAIIISVVKDHNTAEDLMQDTYIKMVKSINSYKKSFKFTAWLGTIARNTAIDYYRKYKNQYSIDIQEHEYLFPIEQATVDDEFNTNYLLSKLTDDEREVVMLYSLDEFKHREIAKILNKPLGTVIWLYNKAISRLREELKDEKR